MSVDGVLYRHWKQRAEKAEAERDALRAALDDLLDYPYIFDGYGCRGCGRDVKHDDSCPVGKALAVWTAAKMGQPDRIRDVQVQESMAALTPPAPAASGERMPDGKCRVCWSSSTFRLPPDWVDRVNRGQSIPIVGCGNPWHYVTGSGMEGTSVTFQPAEPEGGAA